ncbi:hypothetical protein Busp01_55220 [Trinickia caryophylli]|nr:hypothetical protein Busp01_55220 [Trinickia caryophylli]
MYATFRWLHAPAAYRSVPRIEAPRRRLENRIGKRIERPRADRSTAIGMPHDTLLIARYAAIQFKVRAIANETATH